MSNTPSQTLAEAGRRHHKWAARINNISATFRSAQLKLNMSTYFFTT